MSARTEQRPKTAEEIAREIMADFVPCDSCEQGTCSGCRDYCAQITAKLSAWERELRPARPVASYEAEIATADETNETLGKELAEANRINQTLAAELNKRCDAEDELGTRIAELETQLHWLEQQLRTGSRFSGV